MGLNPLNKTELWVNNLSLDGANLTRIAQVAAEVLGLSPDKVLVVDVRPRHITLDILEQDIPAGNILGKERALLDALGAIEGVRLSPDTFVHSNGILGMICLEGQDPVALSGAVARMADEIRGKVAKRAIVFPTGFELREKMIQDTNTPYLREFLEAQGYTVATGEIIEDNEDDMVYRLSDALSRAFGLIITTGGVGAEDKDWSVESVLRLDPAAATPYIVKFERGTGRHVKDGVRIAVGQVGPSLLVALPGPNDEVRIAAPILLDALQEGCAKEVIAQRIAAALADKLMHQHNQHRWNHPTHG